MAYLFVEGSRTSCAAIVVEFLRNSQTINYGNMDNKGKWLEVGRVTLRLKEVTATIAGTRHPGKIEETAVALDYDLFEAIINEIDLLLKERRKTKKQKNRLIVDFYYFSLYYLNSNEDRNCL